MSPAGEEGDRLPTEKQRALAAWFAEYKGVQLPDAARWSRKAWWRWISGQVNRIDREDAREAQIDFHLRLDLTDPVSVVGALKFRDTVAKTCVIDQAVQHILNGLHPYEVQDQLGLTHAQIDEAARRVEVRHEFEIDWGSV
jgi:hypothetical protein